MAKKRKAEVLPLFECNICRCKPFPHNASHIACHEAGVKHKRLAELVNFRSTLESWGIVLGDEQKIQYVCTYCDTNMEPNFPIMKQHFESQHKLSLQISNIPTHEVSKVYRRKTYYEKDYNFEDDKVHFKVLDGTIAIEEKKALSKNAMGIFLADLIPKDKIPYLYRMALALEEHGKAIVRGKRIGGSRMVMYGMLKNHQLTWFVQPHAEMYALSEIFIQKMYRYLKVAFPNLMENLENILVTKGLNGSKGHFGGTPFTCFAITRDYSCLPHDDPTDYRYGIIVWLHPSGEVEKQDQPSFWLPEYKVRFHCGNGAGIVINGNTTVHCTTSPKPIGVLGIAFVQKRPFIVQLSKALKNPNGDFAKNYFKAKEHYITRRDTSIGKGKAVVFY